MLEATRKKLQALYAGGEHRGTDGKMHRIDATTRIKPEHGKALTALHQMIRPNLSIEVGLAYGFSALLFLDAMHEGGYGRHIAIDPYAKSYWNGVGLAAIEDAGLSERLEWIEAPSCIGLTRLIDAGHRAQFVFIDGAHHFDAALVDFSLADRVLDKDGVIILDDLWMPALQRVVSFLEKNMSHFKRIDFGYDDAACFRKIATWDERPWDHFVDFCPTSKSRSWRQWLVGRSSGCRSDR
jgi:predicted O-methyltransferase YrrM